MTIQDFLLSHSHKVHKIKLINMRIVLLFLTLTLTFQVIAQVRVSGYYRRDGTYVRPHYRSNPDGNPYNNWSYPGNVNPYTGRRATGNPDTYLKNYYNRSSNRSSSLSYRISASTHANTSGSRYNEPSNFYPLSHTVTANTLNVRSGPSTNYSVIGSVTYADDVDVIESYANGWKKIQYTYYDINSYSLKTKLGYVSGSYLSSSSSSPENYFIPNNTTIGKSETPSDYNKTDINSEKKDNLLSSPMDYGRSETLFANNEEKGIQQKQISGGNPNNNSPVKQAYIITAIPSPINSIIFQNTFLRDTPEPSANNIIKLSVGKAIQVIGYCEGSWKVQVDNRIGFLKRADIYINDDLRTVQSNN